MSNRNQHKREVNRELILAALSATDQEDSEQFMHDMTSSKVGGLSPKHASVVKDVLREDFVRRAQSGDLDFLVDLPKDKDVEDDDDEPETEHEEDVEPEGDEVEFDADQGDESEESEEKSQPPWLKKGPEEDLDFPSDNEEDFIAEPMSEENEELDLLPGDEQVMTLQDGSILTLKLEKPHKDGALEMSHKEEVPGMPIALPEENTDIETRAAARRTLLRRVQAQTQPESDNIRPGSDPNSHENLGDDTSHGGKPFKMEDATFGVANPGEKRSVMTLENSGGNSLKSDPNFAKQTVPYLDSALEQVAASKEQFRFSPQKDGLFTRTVDDTPDPLPTMGNTDLWWGEKGFDTFDPPSQMPQYTGVRRTQVLAGMNRECAGCDAPEGELEPIACKKCGSSMHLCQACINDDYCPSCAAKESQNASIKEAGLNLDAYCGTPGDRSEIVEDDRGDDVNGDGGFRVKTEGQAPKAADAREMAVEDGQFEKTSGLEKENQRLHIRMAKMAKAVEVAQELVLSGQIEPEEIAAEVGELMEGDSTVASLEHLRRVAVASGKKARANRLASVDGKMNRSAATQIRPTLGVYPNPSSDGPQSGPGELQEALRGALRPRELYEYIAERQDK